jgi:hypothetical protein
MTLDANFTYTSFVHYGWKPIFAKQRWENQHAKGCEFTLSIWHFQLEIEYATQFSVD